MGQKQYWRAGKPERFVRPVRWVVALANEAIVPWRLRGLRPAMRARPSRAAREAPVVLAPPKATDYP